MQFLLSIAVTLISSASYGETAPKSNWYPEDGTICKVTNFDGRDSLIILCPSEKGPYRYIGEVFCFGQNISVGLSVEYIGHKLLWKSNICSFYLD